MTTTQAPVLAPGLYPDVPNAEYQAWDAVSQSRLTILRGQSPKHLRHRIENPEPETVAMMIGTAVHTAVLEPDAFPRRYVRDIEGDGRTKDIKDARRELREKRPEAVILSPDDWALCMRIRDAVRTHPTAKLILDGESERSALWIDEETQLLCKGRFDHVSTVSGVLVDLKTTKNASPAEFERTIFNYGYHIQAAHYLAGANAHGMGMRHHVIIAAEKEPPYAVAVYRIGDATVKAGEQERWQLMARYAQCMATNSWPGYPTQPISIEIPEWAFRRLAESEEAA